MENILLVSTLTLALFARRIYAGSSDVINCAGCFAQKCNWASWQCDVHCDVKTSKYGIFSVTVPGIYHISLTGFSAVHAASMILKLDRNGNTTTLGWSISGGGYKSTSFSLLYELVARDSLYVVGGITGEQLIAPQGQETRNMFTAFLMYKSVA